MKIKTLLFVLITLFNITTLQAQQPFAGCWHPDFIKDWTPEKDPDRKFNRSSIPLQERIATATTVKAHAQQFADGQVAACLTMHPMCSQVPSQGANNFTGYNPTYWQYMDLLIWWGGSAGEGIILPPSAPVIDAAHLNGVKVLGQIFFPPTAFSGIPEWTTQMNTKNPDGTYPYARKCVEIAEYYGFDGWFINSETVHSTNWSEWTADYLAYAKSRGLKGQEIQLYVASSFTSGAYIEDVAKQSGASYMVNYGGISTNNVNNRMDTHVNNNWGDKADAFRTWYYGVEQSGAITGNGNQFKTLFPVNGHIGSINFFNPEEPIWKKTVESLLNTHNASGENAYKAMETVFKNESQFWVNATADATATNRGSIYTMPGLATAVQERSTIQTKPFVTTFSAGLGKHRFVNGEKKGTQDWYHRGMQTIMPTWRWWQTEGYVPANKLKFDYNWDDAYNLGTSINVSGNLTNNTEYNVYLYKTKIAIAGGDKIQLVYKTNKAGSIRIKVADSSNSLNLQALTVTPTSTVKNGWTIDVYDLSALAGKTLTTIGLGIKATDGSGFTAQLGQLAVYPANYNPAKVEVSNLNVENTLGEITSDLRVTWDKPASSDVHHFNVYLERENVKTLIGQTRNEGFYIPKFTRNGQSEKKLKVSVTSVNKDMEEASSGPSKEVSFPDIKLPEVSLKASKTLIAVGEEVTVTAKASSFPENYTWKTSDGATLKSSNGNTAIYTFTKEGLFDISVDVQNAVGTKSYTETKFIHVSQANLNIVSRTANGGKIKAVSSYMTGNKEGPQWLIDDTTIPSSLSQKWCAGGSKEHWVILELKQPYELYRFQIYDCGNKENASDNLTCYKIYTSMSGKDDEWTLALEEKEVPADAAHNIKDDYIKPTIARYVKFVPYNPDMAITIRIWQLDVWGLPATAIPPVINSVSASKSILKPNEEVTFTADVSGEPTSYDWNIAAGTFVSKKENQVTYKFAELGVYDVTLTATNANATSQPVTIKGIVEVSTAREEGKFPLTIKEFDTDLIAENTPAINYAYSFDKQDWAFYTSDVSASGAIPVDTNKIAVSTNATPFRFAPYNGNNAIFLGTGNIIEFEETYSSKALYLLTATSGSSKIFVIVNYSDKTYSELKQIQLQDWCTTSESTAFGTIGRIKLEASDDYEADQTEVQCHMIETKVETDPAKEAVSISVTKTGGITAIFAVTADAKVTYMELEQPQDITLEKAASQNIETSFNLKVAKENDFDISVNSKDNTIAEISNAMIDETAKKVNFAVKGLKTGSTTITITLTNGQKQMARKFTVTVSDQTGINNVNAPVIKITPNPVKAGDKITVFADKANKIRLMTLQGIIVSEQLVKKSVTGVSTAGLQAGTYLLQVVGETSTVSKVIIK
jgi:endo-beta-N-acetylglucosaminidase D/PKD repeat protein